MIVTNEGTSETEEDVEMKRENLKRDLVEKLQDGLEEIVAENPKLQHIIDEIHDNGFEVSYGMTMMVYLRDRAQENPLREKVKFSVTKEDEEFLHELSMKYN